MPLFIDNEAGNMSAHFSVNHRIVHFTDSPQSDKVSCRISEMFNFRRFLSYVG